MQYHCVACRQTFTLTRAGGHLTTAPARACPICGAGLTAPPPIHDLNANYVCQDCGQVWRIEAAGGTTDPRGPHNCPACGADASYGVTRATPSVTPNQPVTYDPLRRVSWNARCYRGVPTQLLDLLYETWNANDLAGRQLRVTHPRFVDYFAYMVANA